MFLKLESTLVLLVTFFILVIGSTSAQSLGATENSPNEMLQLVNETRAASQVCGATSMPPASPLILNQLLNQAAQGHSVDMASNNFFSHYGSDNSTYDQRIKAQGYSFSEASENIAAIGKTPKETLIQWMASEAHCKNIMNPDFTQLGMGMSENPDSTYINYWTLKFGTPDGEGQTGSPLASTNNLTTATNNLTSATQKNPQNAGTTIQTPQNNQSINNNSAITTVNTQITNTLNSTTNFSNEMLQLVNATRSVSQVCGSKIMPPVAPLTLNSLLNQAAQVHSYDMATNNFFSHSGSNNSTHVQRIQSQGYSFSKADEIVTAIEATPRNSLSQWMQSEERCSNIMSSDFTQMGLGMSENPSSTWRYYWTLVFAAPASQAQTGTLTAGSPTQATSQQNTQNLNTIAQAPQQNTQNLNTTIQAPQNNQNTSNNSANNTVNTQTANTQAANIQTSTDNFPNEMLQLVNQTRSASQVCGATSMPPASPLTLNQLLNQAAQGHSHDMASNDFFSHYGSDNSTYDQRINAQGYSFSEASENIAAIGKTPQETMIQWMKSEAHCKNIMNPDFTQLGMGMSENPASTYGNYWTLKFGTPASNGG